MPSRPLLPLALLAAAACGPRVPARPAPAPARTPGPAATPAPATVSAAEPARAMRLEVTYQPGFAEYVVTSQALVHVEGDSLGAREDSVATRARFSLRVSPANAPRGVVVTVDSFLVSPTRGAPLASALAIPLAFQAQLDESLRRIDFLAEQPMLGAPCTGPAFTLLAVARDLVAPLPATVEKGARWTESGSHQLCRGGVPLTVASRHEWRVDDIVEQEGRTLVRLHRETQATIAGSGSGRRAGARIDGTSRAAADYLVDPQTGRLHHATVASTAELKVVERAGGPVITSRQDARQEAVALAPAQPAQR